MPEPPDDNPTLTWLGLRSLPDFTKARWLGPLFAVFLAVILVALFVGGLATLVLFLEALFGTGIFDDEKSHEAVRNLGIVLAGVLGAPFIVWRTMVAQKQSDIAAKSQSVAEQGHITDRITKAVEQLGAERTVKTPGKDAHGNDVTMETTVPDIVVRIGSIYALERIAADSQRDQVKVLELLNDYLYVRNADRDTIDLEDPSGVPISPKDMAVIAKILARNDWNG